MKVNKKNWYKIKEDVEYSTDFNFFLQHQIATFITNGNTITFVSRLEAKGFYQKKFGTISIIARTDNIDVNKKCREIHKEILAGRHGKGTFVN